MAFSIVILNTKLNLISEKYIFHSQLSSWRNKVTTFPKSQKLNNLTLWRHQLAVSVNNVQLLSTKHKVEQLAVSVNNVQLLSTKHEVQKDLSVSIYNYSPHNIGQFLS